MEEYVIAVCLVILIFQLEGIRKLINNQSVLNGFMNNNLRILANASKLFIKDKDDIQKFEEIYNHYNADSDEWSKKLVK